MVHYIVIAFMLGLGWHLGKLVVELIGAFAEGIIRSLVPRRYWDVRHPDYWATKKEQKNKNNSRTVVKGFYKD